MPVAYRQEIGIQRGFGRAGLGMPVVTPFHDRRQRHQDGFGASARLQAEQGAAVEYQVEFDVAAAPVGLEVALALAVGQILAPLQNRQIGAKEGVAHAFRHAESVVEAAFGEIVEEHAADAARFVAVPEKEVAVAPFLETRVQAATERVERGLAGGVEMPCVVFESVIRRQVHAAAEPPYRGFAVLQCNEAAHVHVHRRHVRIARMQHQRYAHRFPLPAGEFGAVGTRRRWQPAAQHVREVHPAAFQHAAFLDQPRDAAAAVQGRSGLAILWRGGGALPGIGAERQAVGGFQRSDDARLQVEQPGFDCACIERGGVEGVGRHQGRSIVPVARSIRVEGRRRRPMRPATTRTRAPNILRHSAAVFADLRPLLLALVETSAMPRLRHRRAAPRWAVTRTAIVGRPPVSAGRQFVEAGTTQVTGPGQLRSIRARSVALTGRMKGRSRLKRSAISNRPLAASRPFRWSSRFSACGLRGSQPRP